MSPPAAPAPGTFITFEGPEGAGKTTQLARLAERLTAAGHQVVRTREPGGTPAGESIRRVLLDPREAPLTPLTEALLFCAARAELVAGVIRPALAAGSVVLCDRFADATFAYQGYGRGLPLDALRSINAVATGGLVPRLTLLLDLPAATGLARRRQDDADWNRFDADSLAFHQRVRDGYLALAAEEPARWRVIDADAAPETVGAAVWQAVAGHLAALQTGQDTVLA